MPGLTHRNEHYSSGFWSKDVDGVNYNQLHKFWIELSPEARHKLLRVDRQALLEQARKNTCCSKCIGLLHESFLQIASNGKSLQPKGVLPSNRSGALLDQDPTVHRWGGLTATRDRSLTLLDCYLCAKSFKGIQTVFDSARARERERELLYPHACGSQGMVGYGKGHGTRETCSLHTTRLSCDALAAFWSTLKEESRQSLSRMKEEDFIERLTNRFKHKKFCKDCRRNVIREFKELKRVEREPQCTNWFCVADTAIHYEVDDDSVRADWSQYFTKNDGYQYIEWGIGTEEGKTDILKYKYVGNDGSAQVNGLDLRGLHQCYITVRAFKDNGRCSEVSVKAHALRGGQQCVHSWLVVGDGFVSVKRRECIRMLFEHAEDVEEEEDEVVVDKDGNEVERPQKHAKTPELAREFLLDAAAVIFKEQVEKAYRESTARQNAESVFVCLSCKLLEQRVHIACKEIVTLEKQKKLVEEEEKEKREEEERKGRKRTKEREKKLRRKERLKETEEKNPKFSDKPTLPVFLREEEGSSLNVDEEMNTSVCCEESVNETGDVHLSPPVEKHEEDERKARKRTKEREKKLRRKERLKEKEGEEEQKHPKFSDKPREEEEEEGFLNVDEEMNSRFSCEEESATETGDRDCLVGCTVREVIIDNEDGNGCFTTKESKKNDDDMYLKDPMMSRTSSSDNCSSCLSEEESNGSTESSSSSMSDTEDVSQHSEGREELVFTENYCQEKMTKKETEKNISDLPGENMVATGSYLSQPQSSMMFPQRPVFQAPCYYHQAPVSWSAAPANRLMPFPHHPNPHVYTGPLGYGLNGEFPYGNTPLNPSATPFFNSLRPGSVSHPYAEINSVDQGHPLESLEAANERRYIESPSSRGPQTDSDNDFSLFHFSGPVALSTGSKSGSAHYKDEILGDFFLHFSGDHVLTGSCKKKKKKKESTTVGEEYNLFAKSNSLRFSIF